MIDTFIPDFKKACNTANEILVCSDAITTFPFSMDSFIEKETEFEMMYFSELRALNIKPEEAVFSNDGALIDRNGKYIMFLNDDMPEKRQKFTECHECGHYYLQHDIEKLTEYRKNNDPRFMPLYKKYEAEANMFSAQLQMPEQIIIELSKRGCRITQEFIASVFGVSLPAADLRMKNIKKIYDWYNLKNNHATIDYDDIILQKFKPFINSIAPHKFSYIEEFEREEEMERERQSWY